MQLSCWHRWSGMTLLAALVGIGLAQADQLPAQALSHDSTAAPLQHEFLQWQFSYRGAGVKAEGIVTTDVQPSPDGTYRIVKVEGKRNRRDILGLAPDGEVVTMQGHLFADNRLWSGSPFLSQGGFTFRTKRGQYFNVCYSGPYEGCGENGYHEFNYRSEPRAIDFKLEQIGVVTDMALAMDAESPADDCNEAYVAAVATWSDRFVPNLDTASPQVMLTGNPAPIAAAPSCTSSIDPRNTP
jgi:hypothetical protein